MSQLEKSRKELSELTSNFEVQKASLETTRNLYCFYRLLIKYNETKHLANAFLNLSIAFAEKDWDSEIEWKKLDESLVLTSKEKNLTMEIKLSNQEWDIVKKQIPFKERKALAQGMQQILFEYSDILHMITKGEICH